MLFLCFIWLCLFNFVIAYETVLEPQPHGFTAHKSFTLRTDNLVAEVEVPYPMYSKTNLIWMWTRFSCTGTLDIYRKTNCSHLGVNQIEECPSGKQNTLYNADIPVKLSRRGNDYRVNR
eukprot:UN00369